ncbi:MAG: long-chain fatty acid--CoA ligase [Trueperaceae bacterium]|nr:MAG: long-chain fatty acid--CoA ligase [Trueperaceae bacterium]
MVDTMTRNLTHRKEDRPDVSPIYQAPVGSGEVVLGRTLPSLLREAAEENPNPRAFNQHGSSGWSPLSTRDFLRRSEDLALGLRGRGLDRGDRVALFTHSDTSFCLTDMACLMAGLVDVPIYLTHTHTAIEYVLNESEARVLVVSDRALLEALGDLPQRIPSLSLLVVFEADDHVPSSLAGIEVTTFSRLELEGSAIREDHPGRIDEYDGMIDVDDVATIIYTSGTTGLPKGVMLTHENISSNVIAAMTGLPSFHRGEGETALSFLPLTHIFARTLQYAYMWYGTTVYFSDPTSLRDHMQEVHPTFFAAVPRVIEKAFERILAAGQALTGLKKPLFNWSLGLARQFEVGAETTGLYELQRSIADRLVFSKWREALGGRIRTIIVGGAAIRPELVNVFAAAGIELLQGYGLTETSPVIAFNRAENNRAGTVGPPLAGVEVMIGGEGEILARGPNIMKGYYKQPGLTDEVLDTDGWFHTGDLGKVTPDGFLQITGRLKNLFKLSTGKYVMPQPLEERLEAHALVDAAVVIGEDEKYCAALLFINAEEGSVPSSETGAMPDASHQIVLQQSVKRAAAEANHGFPPWSTVKKVALIFEELSIENGTLTPKLSVRREEVLAHYRDYVEALYHPAGQVLDRGVIVDL